MTRRESSLFGGLVTHTAPPPAVIAYGFAGRLTGSPASVHAPGVGGRSQQEVDPTNAAPRAIKPLVEAVLQRCGADTFDLVLIDLDGNWTRGVFPSQEAAQAVAARAKSRPKMTLL